MEANDLAAELGISPTTLRAWLRRTYQRSDADHNTRWNLTEAQVTAARGHFGRAAASPITRKSGPPASELDRGRATSDEAYVIDLCDEILGERALRQHRFEWLLGDPGTAGSRVPLPVDAYYPGHRLVIEYRERQHDSPVAHFDKPDRMTVSGVHRGEQRRIYDERRAHEIPAKGLRLVVIGVKDLSSDSRGRLRRDRESDLNTLRRLFR